MKQYIVKNQRYEYTFAELAIQWALQYNINPNATRPRKPKDKPTVENTVYQSSTARPDVRTIAGAHLQCVPLLAVVSERQLRSKKKLKKIEALHGQF